MGMSRRKRTEREDRERIRGWLANHGVKERVSISWHLNALTKDGHYDSHYAYSVTWTPGSLTIAGDLGEFAVTHYHAMPSIVEAIRWLDGIEFDYLMGKSNAKREFDRDETVRDIIRMANEDAVETFLDCRKEAKSKRRAHIEALCEWDSAETCWAVAGDDAEDRPVLADYLPDPDGFETRDRLTCEKRDRFGAVISDFNYGGKTTQRAPDGFALWLALYEAFEHDVDDRALGANMIFHAWGRREIKEALEAYLGDCGADHAAELCRGKLDIDDYYGAYSWPFSCLMFAEAIQRWVNLVKDQYLVPKEPAVQPVAEQETAA